jgi:hypothetical protein
LLGVAADSVVMGVSGPERATDPNEDIYKAAHEAWLGTNQEKENQRCCLLAKLDHARDDLGNYYPSLPVLAALEPHHERERVCPNAAAGCPVVESRPENTPVSSWRAGRALSAAATW